VGVTATTNTGDAKSNVGFVGSFPGSLELRRSDVAGNNSRSYREQFSFCPAPDATIAA